MAKTTRIKLNDTTKLLSDISKQLNGITNQLVQVGKVINKDINDSVKKNLNESIKVTRIEVNNLFKDIRKASTDLNKLKDFNPIGTLAMSAIGNTQLGKSLSMIGEMNTNRVQGIENANVEYESKMGIIGKKRKEVEDQYLKQMTRINQTQMSGKFTKEEADAQRDLYTRFRAKKEATLDKQAGKALSEKNEALALNSITNMAKGAALSIASVVIQEAIKLGKKIYENTKKMIDDVASYAVSSSYIVNSSAREQMLTYGLSESQNYAFTQAKSLMGISSDEDLFWMNDNQRAMFSRLMEKESEIYDKMTSNGTLEGFQEMQIDIALLKQEFYAEIVKFVSDNKDLILNTMDVTITALTGLLQVTTWIFNAVQKTNPFYWGDKLFSGKEASSITLNTYVTSNSADAEEVADATTNSTLATLSTYVNS